MPAAPPPPGHVFVLRGDLTRIACDAWLLPTDRRLRVGAKWHHALPAELLDGEHLTVAPPPGWDASGPGSFPLPRTDAPAIWATDVGGSADTPVGWYRRALASFIDRAAASLADRPTDRERPLLAVPVVGSGAGGGAAVVGALLADLIAELQAAVERTGVDVVLVTNEEHAFAAAQAARRSRDDATALDGPLAATVERLAHLARGNELVLFLGGGVSMGAGLPSWQGLMERLALEAGLPEAEREAYSKLDVLDQGRIVQHRLAVAGVDLGELLCRVLASPRTSLAHALLANLPVDEVVTTNFDQLFEMASEAAGRPVAVLPYQRTRSPDRWLLKLHGSLDRPEEIVLTREDYLRYSERRAALGGIVQAMLITKHMVFVGFSLSDDNFHRIVDEVRRALGPTGHDDARSFATALLLQPEPLLAELWAGEVEFVPAGGPTVDERRSARRLEVFLDHLLLEASDLSAHLLDDRFTDLLTEDERRLKAALDHLAAGEAEYHRAPAWRLVAQLLERLGRDG